MTENRIYKIKHGIINQDPYPECRPRFRIKCRQHCFHCRHPERLWKRNRKIKYKKENRIII